MTFDANLWDALIVRIEVSDRGELLWEFQRIHRVSTLRSGKVSETTFDTRFFHLLIIRIEVSTRGYLL